MKTTDMGPVARMLHEGKSEDEIVSALVERYNFSPVAARFMYDIVTGRSDGDVITVDAQGNEVREQAA